MQIQRDGNGQPFIEWTQAPGGFKRAWIQRKPKGEKDWASTPDGRYLNVVRIEKLGSGPAGNATDFPIFSELSDEQILLAFVTAVSAITGCHLKVDPAGATVKTVGSMAGAVAKVDPAGSPAGLKMAALAAKVDPAG